MCLDSTFSWGKIKHHRRVFISLNPINCSQMKSLPTELLEVLTVHNKLSTHAPRGQRVRQDNNTFTFSNCESNVSCQPLPRVEQRNASGSSIIICPSDSCQNLTTGYFPWKSLSVRGGAIVLQFLRSVSCGVAEAIAVMCSCSAVAASPARRCL